jgi:hypothetical protein
METGLRVQSRARAAFVGHDSRFPAQDGQGSGKTKDKPGRCSCWGGDPNAVEQEQKNLGLGQQLRMDLKTDDCFVGIVLLDD